MTIPKLSPLFSSYKDILHTKGLDDELYKWRAVQHFQENYDETAENFGEMFLNAISKHTNLIDHWQLPFINELARLNSEGMRSLISDLYDESFAIEQRIEKTRNQFKVLSEELKKHPDHDHSKKLQQEERTISIYLGFRYPEKYPFYKYSFYQKLCSQLGEPIEKAGKRLTDYYKVTAEIRKELEADQEAIVSKVHDLRTEDCFQGDDIWIIVQDVLYQTLDKNPIQSDQEKPSPTGKRQYWLVSPGEQAVLWKNAQDEGVIRIGWDYTGDLSEYENEADVRTALIESDGRQGSRMNDVRACWDFCKKMQVGDIVITKQGRNKLLGWGEVTSDYEYLESYDSFNHTRKVKWEKAGEWKANDIPIPLKTLTDWTRFPDHIENIRRIIFGEEKQIESTTMDLPLNLILYGPPGTGKTYTLSKDFFPRFTDVETSQTKEEFTNEMVAQLSWWEVMTVVMLDLKKASVTEILAHPVCQSKVSLSNNGSPRAAIWAQLQSHTKTDCPDVNYRKRIEPLIFWKDEKSTWSIDEELAAELVPQAQELLDNWKRGPSSESQQKRYVFTTFHQSYAYEDFIEGIRPVLSQEGEAELGEISYEIRPGVFREIAKRAALNPNKPYAIFIDEINRGNIASVFGELITLIEDDKRTGADSELEATLPYSKERFSVPSNLHIIGTMNTADRSVESLDTALRRRFSFKEMLPNPDLIPNPKIEGVDVKRLLRTINERLELLLDKDHTIGHAFFWSCQSISDLRKAFANKIIPLLEEFFYNDTAKIGMVLGPKLVNAKQQTAKLATGPWDSIDVEERDVFEIADIATLSSEAFQSIYEAK